MDTWIGQPEEEEIKNYQGFVYFIINKLNNKYYIGKKFFWKKITRKPLKGKKRKRHELVESDWRDYWSSSPKLQKDVGELGAQNFERTIIKLCKNRFECAYYEAYYQITMNVLFDDNSYNECINLRLRKFKRTNL